MIKTNCKLPIEKRQFENAKKLINNCNNINCYFYKNFEELDLDNLPNGCVLLVAALLAAK